MRAWVMQKYFAAPMFCVECGDFIDGDTYDEYYAEDDQAGEEAGDELCRACIEGPSQFLLVGYGAGALYGPSSTSKQRDGEATGEP